MPSGIGDTELSAGLQAGVDNQTHELALIEYE
jgi:hypothetical protein